MVSANVDVMRQPVLVGAKLASAVAIVKLLDKLGENLNTTLKFNVRNIA